ncbi:YitT family protein [Reichenbachiella sp.]|uniref:YitT family protein n=1 Tax=Reichenbachiella sp. TaxID=2184521 RepID=UPI003B5B7D44
MQFNENKQISEVAQKALERRILLRSRIKDFFFIFVGVSMASIGLKGFLLPNDFLDGGAMGVALLFDLVTPLDLSLLILLVNAPFIAMGYKQISPQFAIKSTLAIVALSSLVHFIEIPPFTADKLLISLFGGFFLGSGIGLSIRGGAVIDGTEVLAVSVSRKSSLTVGDAIALFNILLFIVAIWLVSLETAMYSMLTYLAASKTVDFIINGIEEYIGVMIVSDEAEQIKSTIANDLGRGVTAFRADGGYGKKGDHLPDRKILFCAITRMEISKILLEVEKIDPAAFVIQYPIKDTKGGMIKKRPLH